MLSYLSWLFCIPKFYCVSKMDCSLVESISWPKRIVFSQIEWCVCIHALVYKRVTNKIQHCPLVVQSVHFMMFIRLDNLKVSSSVIWGNVKGVACIVYVNLYGRVVCCKSIRVKIFGKSWYMMVFSRLIVIQVKLSFYLSCSPDN